MKSFSSPVVAAGHPSSSDLAELPDLDAPARVSGSAGSAFTVVPALAGEAALEGQLYRYAQDLADLAAQHERLQRRYQAVLEMYGQSVHAQDLFLDYVAQPDLAVITTDTAGHLLQVSPPAQALLGMEAGAWPARDLAGLVDESSRGELEDVLEQFLHGVGQEAVVQAQFHWRQAGAAGGSATAAAEAALAPASALRDTLALPLRRGELLQIHWLISPRPARPEQAPLEAQRELLLLPEDSCGMMITNPEQDIVAVNGAFAGYTGYEAEEIIGCKPGVLASGRHSRDFYRAFWSRLRSTGSWTGHIYNRRRDGHIYPEWKTVRVVRRINGELLSYIARNIDSAQRESSLRQLSRLAYYDAVTGLPNRRLFDERLAQALARHNSQSGAGFGVVFLDLDGFKAVNDEFGHEAGDRVLQQIAQRLQDGLRRGDTVARNGGDEFLLLLPHTRRSEDIAVVVDDLQRRITQAIEVEGRAIHLSASMGIARYPIDGSDGASLVRLADQAMYRAKRGGGHHACAHESSFSASTGMDLRADLCGAVERGEFQLAFQPQVRALPPYVLHGCEVLLRWKHPRLGELTPSAFLAQACETGAIVAIGRWVLEQACHQLHLWAERGLGEFMLSVNVSRRELRNPDFATHVRQVLDRQQVPDRLLQFEVAEDDIALLDEQDIRRLMELRAGGIRLAVDHFGAGGTNVKRLQGLKVDQIKIDRHFVHDVAESRDARALMNSLIGVGTAMNTEVIAEGVETSGQMEILVQLGCPIVQGHLTGRPMSARAFGASVFWQQRFGRPSPLREHQVTQVVGDEIGRDLP